jgi:hypothetical protein
LLEPIGLLSGNGGEALPASARERVTRLSMKEFPIGEFLESGALAPVDQAE